MWAASTQSLSRLWWRTDYKSSSEIAKVSSRPDFGAGETADTARWHQSRHDGISRWSRRKARSSSPWTG
jgi:hypothetical protein